jgi:WD40 repeat protein
MFRRMAPVSWRPTLVVNARAPASQALRALSLAAAASCGFPAPDACDLVCGAEGACPDGFECQADSQRCVPRGTEAPCQQRASLPEQPEPSASGGMGPGAVGQGGSGGQAGAAASPDPGAGAATGGNAGGPSAAGGSDASTGKLAIEDTSSSPISCTGAELGRSLRVSGGVGPFTWRVLRAPAGVEFSGLDTETLVVSGVATEPGALEVELEDGAGSLVHSSELVVFESPRIANQALPAVCSGEPYEVQLVASGGVPDEYVWSAELDAEGRPSDTLEALGLAVHGPTLSGDLAAAAADLAPFGVALTVSDGRCRSSVAAFELHVVPASSDRCPRIQILDAPPVDALPSPCLGNGYREALTVEGGEPPYEWRALSTPPGLSFDVESATLDGVAQGDGVLAVALTDGSSRTIRKSYDVQARDKCWLAYIATDPGPPHLELVDGRLLARQPADARRTAPVNSSLGNVVDFAFSPDGRFLVYRLGANADALGLELLRLSDGGVYALELDGSVAAYAWSPDGATLAVAWVANGQTMLGGVDVSAVERVVPAPGAPLAGVRSLSNRAAPSVDSELAWFDARRLGFLSRASAAARRRLVTTELGAGGFAAPLQRGTVDFSDAARLVDGGAGVFVADPETGLHEFFPSDGSAPLTHAPELVLSPSGVLGGLARDGALQIFRPGEPSGLAAVPFAAADGCTTLLAWAADRDRVACADERGAENQVSLFDVPAAGASIVPLASIPEPYLYPAGEHSGRRRLLSPSGRWFAFASDANLYVSRSDESSSRLAATLSATRLGTRPGALAFSPDEAFLLVGAGNSVALLDLGRGQSVPLILSSSAAIDDDCNERFVDGASGWCGREPRSSELAWSSGSDLVAFRSSLGSLFLVDVSLAAAGIVGDPITPDGGCSEACLSSQSARFQP